MIAISMAFLLRKLFLCLRWGRKEKQEGGSDLQRSWLPTEAPAAAGLEAALREAAPHSLLVHRKGVRDAAAEPEPAADVRPEDAPKPVIIPAVEACSPAMPSAASPGSKLTTPLQGPGSRKVAAEAGAAEEKGQEAGGEQQLDKGSELTFPTPGPMPLTSHNSGSCTPLLLRSFQPATATPAPAKGACLQPEGTPLATPAGALRFMFENSTSPHVTGVAITASKRAPDQPVHIRSTPYEQRIERELAAEQQAIDRYKRRVQHGQRS